MNVSHRLGWCAVIGVALVPAACDVKVGDGGVSLDFAAGRARDEWVRTYDLPPGGRLEIVNVNGAIEASPSGSGRVEVRATRDARAASDEAARDLLQSAEMIEEVTADRVSVQARLSRPRRGGVLGPQLTIRYEVRAPPGLHLVLRTQNGEVRLSDIEGRLSAATTNGAVTGRGLSGSVEASTVNGGLQIDLAAVTGDSRLETVNGGIRLELAPDAKVDLEASVVNGGVSVADTLPLASAERTRQRVTGRLNGGGPRVAVQTTNGGVRIVSRREAGE